MRRTKHQKSVSNKIDFTFFHITEMAVVTKYGKVRMTLYLKKMFGKYIAYFPIVETLQLFLIRLCDIGIRFLY